MKVFLAGEGPDDLGDWYHLPQHRASPPEVGVIEALVRKLGAADAAIIDARIWKRIKKYRFKPHVRGEVHNVLVLAMEAEEAGADVLVFVRDQDGYEDRQRDVEEGIRAARERYGPRIAGGVAVQEIEAWILAVLGERRSEQHADAKAVLRERHGIEARREKVAVIEREGFARVPEDAASLRAWLHEATVALLVAR